MNASMDSPFEALLFNYSTFNFLTLFINNLWTWLAAATFWKFSSTKPEFLQLPHSPVFDQPDPIPEVLESDAVTTEPACVPSSMVANVCDDVDGVRKGKVTIYFEDDVECDNGEVLNVVGKWEEGDGVRYNGCESEWWENWERLLKLKVGENENGWYTWQDLTDINGNVVRLWDSGEFRFGAFTQESRSRSCSSCVHLWN
ncbi:hypothetical protein TanjilG_29198 [Lupinus angustifolius]|uniref:Uncharacterized protein n=1 Tax=Lupinus angustifolius TaxID=3871 RepID=A0A1J7GIA9_LUPAN|nr:PREDICTED: uncharacterized protein LOC109361717 [Lupinus angustifolius]OIW00208.1 hypothetical protein TanjilG_29198 [Lupinus angustifolius]